MFTPTHIVTDIEGTTTSIDFVHKQLFPYSSSKLASFLSAHWDDDFMLPIRLNLAKELSLPDDATLSREVAQEALHLWIKQDKKITALKTLQGHIWEDGYRSGALRGHVYPDAAEVLQHWKSTGKSISIFSSGSIAAQKLLFRHSTSGDLLPLLSGHFDTTTGPKRERASYEQILQSISGSPDKTVFLSDTEEELDAASECGILTVQIVRAEDRTVPSKCHRVCANFFEVDSLFDDRI